MSDRIFKRELQMRERLLNPRRGNIIFSIEDVQEILTTIDALRDEVESWKGRAKFGIEITALRDENRHLCDKQEVSLLEINILHAEYETILAENTRIKEAMERVRELASDYDAELSSADEKAVELFNGILAVYIKNKLIEVGGNLK